MKPRPDDIIKDRKIDLCPNTKDCSVSSLVKKCSFCKTFLLYCCSCETEFYNLPDSERPDRVCHHFRIVFTDGACTDNGQVGAKAGVGIACGSDDNSQMSVAITDSLDPYPLRSNQRAELLAAKLGLMFLAADALDTLKPTERLKDKSRSWLIATDSEYVVKGMTEWLPRWKRNNWRTSKGTKPLNLDLFLALDAAVQKYEAKHVKIGFWWIPREDNTIADGLAKAAAIDGQVASL